jgi:hypothetical protein
MNGIMKEDQVRIRKETTETVWKYNPTIHMKTNENTATQPNQ